MQKVKERNAMAIEKHANGTPRLGAQKRARAALAVLALSSLCVAVAGYSASYGAPVVSTQVAISDDDLLFTEEGVYYGGTDSEGHPAYLSEPNLTPGEEHTGYQTAATPFPATWYPTPWRARCDGSPRSARAAFWIGTAGLAAALFLTIRSRRAGS